MKRFMHCLNLVEAHHCANLLRSAGIHAEVRNTFLAGAVGDIPFIEAGPQIWIDDRQDETIARTILTESEQAPRAASWRCERCGETMEGQFAQCWNCGALKPFEHDS
ncbi:putative signal transducing protein [Rhodocyclaceae bacterium SMB388]